MQRDEHRRQRDMTPRIFDRIVDIIRPLAPPFEPEITLFDVELDPVRRHVEPLQQPLPSAAPIRPVSAGRQKRVQQRAQIGRKAKAEIGFDAGELFFSQAGRERHPLRFERAADLIQLLLVHAVSPPRSKVLPPLSLR
ncbi:MAG: hypothetical protein JWO97_3951 [Acidobacteria bacterium]|nr:hypothetical protein [Acidobacteriota bacterium]